MTAGAMMPPAPWSGRVDEVKGEVAGGEQVGQQRPFFIAQRQAAPEVAVKRGEEGVGAGMQPILVDILQQREGKPDEGKEQRAIAGACAQAVHHAPEDEAGGEQRHALRLRRGDEGGGGQGEDEGEQGEGDVNKVAVHGFSSSGTGTGSG